MHRLFVSQARVPRLSADNPAAGRAGGSPPPPPDAGALPVSYEPRSPHAPTAPAAGCEKTTRKSPQKAARSGAAQAAAAGQRGHRSSSKLRRRCYAGFRWFPGFRNSLCGKGVIQPCSRFFPPPLRPISMNKERLIPLIVATALFMENMDSTVIATSLPAIAADIGASPLTLKLAITSYLLSLAVFIPASGWTADRFGARMVFSIAVGVFIVGSIGCALSSSVTDFVIARMVQGFGGAMMTPVGRLVLLRSIDKSALVNAMAWVTVPALVGPVIGPPLGGFITTYLTWHWIFLINIPIGLIGIVMALRYIDPIRSEDPERFDLYGLVLAGIGLGGIAFGLSIAGLNLVPWTVVITLVAIGTISMTLYVIHARRTASPVLDFALLRLPTMRASIIGGFLFRLGIGSLPFLLPLLMQV